VNVSELIVRTLREIGVRFDPAQYAAQF